MDKAHLFVQKLHTLLDSQRTFLGQSVPENPLSFEHYDQLQLLLLQECDRLGYHRNTKFLARTYFDLAVSRLKHMNPDTAPLYLLTAMGLAVKFNENRQTSEPFSIPAMLQITHHQFQHKHFLEAELQLLDLLQYRLHIVTPYDYAVLFRQLLGKYHNKKVLGLKIDRLLDFAISLPYSSLLSPCYLYCACLIEALERRLKREDLQLISECIKDQEELKRIRQFVRGSMEKLRSEQQLRQSDFNAV